MDPKNHRAPQHLIAPGGRGLQPGGAAGGVLEASPTPQIAPSAAHEPRPHELHVRIGVVAGASVVRASVETHPNLHHFLSCEPDRPEMLQDAAAAANADSSLRSRQQVLESGLVSPLL